MFSSHQEESKPPKTILPPRCLVLQWGHGSKLACHPGAARTLALVQQHFWWPSIKEDVQEFVAACNMCPEQDSQLTPCRLAKTPPNSSFTLVSHRPGLRHRTCQLRWQHMHPQLLTVSPRQSISSLCPSFPQLKKSLNYSSFTFSAYTDSPLTSSPTGVLSSLCSSGGPSANSLGPPVVSPQGSTLKPTARQNGQTKIWRWHSGAWRPGMPVLGVSTYLGSSTLITLFLHLPQVSHPSSAP
ncbi:uncharacterized protein LOC132889529 [Neoarius graeffei]|uniref:uncharacterized protein LOC132889529 n=1 Tax=Neoarius graeffei TaxID=443677 RepID=UPI00298D31C6|nr:uncharacterized protein LOC132889529 [Neoarius graeffei]